MQYLNGSAAIYTFILNSTCSFFLFSLFYSISLFVTQLVYEWLAGATSRTLQYANLMVKVSIDEWISLQIFR